MSLFQEGKLISKKEFRLFLIRHFFPKINAVEKERKQIFNIYIVGAICLSLLILGLYEIRFFQSRLSGLFFILPLLIGWVRVQSFVDEQKMRYMPVLLETLGDISGYQATLNETLVKKSLLQKNFDVFDVDDAFSGVYRQTSFSVAEVVLGRDISLYRDYKRHGLICMLFLPKRYKMDFVFRGIYIAIPMTKKVKSHTLVYHKSLLKKYQIGFQSAEIEDVAFMKNHRIFTQDQIEVRRILTPIFIERLKKMARVFVAPKIDMAFFDGYALFQLYTKKDMFEPFSIFRKITDVDLFMKFYDEVESVCEMIAALKIENKESEYGVVDK